MPTHRNPWSRWLGWLALAVSLGVGAGCESTESAHRTTMVEPSQVRSTGSTLSALRHFEGKRRQQTDFSALPASNGRFGANPYRLLKLPGAVAGLLEGSNELVIFDESLTPLATALTPLSPAALAMDPMGLLYVAGELEPRVAAYEWSGSSLVRRFDLLVPGVAGVRAIAALGSGRLAVAEEVDGRLLELTFKVPTATKDAVKGGPPGVACVQREVGRTHGPIALRKSSRWLLLSSVLSHSIRAYRLTERGTIAGQPESITHDGPIWAFDILERGARTWVISAGVENAPLDRTIGSFGNIDSFLYLHELTETGFRLAAALNLSARGIVTPKVLLARAGPTPLTMDVVVAGYASDALLELQISVGGEPTDGTPTVEVRRRRKALPGVSAAVWASHGRLFVANPLFDLWGTIGESGPAGTRWVAAAEPNSTVDARWRLGEALFFTTLMAPSNKSEGPLSRFTCETCHFEGYVDGRVHHTGRQQVRASTKPLLGLFNNRPHFSRALDKDLSRVAHAEFRVAGAGSGTDPWFSVSVEQFPWLERLGGGAQRYEPLELRKALMAYLMRFSHRTNPSVFARTQWSPEERRGARIFENRCESCHRARLAADDGGTRLRFAEWERWSLSSNGPIVWGLAEYKKTGVLPYVHANGARVPSLRRLYKKWPYLTNGSAHSVEEVLRRCRFGPASSFSHAAGAGESLSEEEQAALAAFLRLL